MRLVGSVHEVSEVTLTEPGRRGGRLGRPHLTLTLPLPLPLPLPSEARGETPCQLCRGGRALVPFKLLVWVLSQARGRR